MLIQIRPMGNSQDDSLLRGTGEELNADIILALCKFELVRMVWAGPKNATIAKYQVMPPARPAIRPRNQG